MTIVTQDLELINYDSLKKICSYSGEVVTQNPKGEPELTEIFIVVGYDTNAYNMDDDEIGDAIQLGIYGSHDECTTVIEKMIDSIENSDRTFIMPSPYFSEENND